MKKNIFLIFVCLFATQVFAEDDWFDSQRSTFNQFSEKSQSIYKSFVDKNDAEFLRWLRQQWKVYRRFDARVRDVSPKPEVQPAKDQADVVMSNGLPSLPDLSTQAGATKAGATTQKQPPLQKGSQVSIIYYGHQVEIAVPVGLRSLSIKKVNAEALADAFEFLAKVRELPVLKSLAAVKDRYQLSDWATVQLVQQTTAVLYPPGVNRSFLNWYLLSKLNFQAQMGIVSSQLVVLMPAQQLVYGKPYYMIKGEAYYPVGDYVEGDLQTYPGQYFAENKTLDLRFNKTLLAGKARQQRKLQWPTGNTWQQLSIHYNPYRVEYFKDYPQIDLGYYFDAPIDSHTAQNLKQQLQPMLVGKTPRQQVNLLLAFIQQSFTYTMDQTQFGEENYLLPEETLYYPASDCEDRAFLFAWLVRELVGLPVVGVTYPGHVAAAVAFDDVKGNDMRLDFNGRDYSITDPTYLGSEAGQVMVQYRNVMPKVVPIL